MRIQFYLSRGSGKLSLFHGRVCNTCYYSPFSCSVINICKAMAASTLTGKSLSLHNALRVSSKACLKLFSFLNFNSQKCFKTQQAWKKKRMVYFNAIHTQITMFTQNSVMKMAFCVQGYVDNITIFNVLSHILFNITTLLSLMYY